MDAQQQAISAVFLAVVITTGAFVPFVQPTTAQNESPAPTLDDVEIPDEVTVGESFEVVVDASNDGGRAGAYSTITVSSPDLDDSGDGSQVTVTDDFDHSYSTVSDAGDEIYDKNGDSITAEYALAEAGTTEGDFWDGGESRSFATEITPEESGTLKINVRVTLIDDDDSSKKYTAPRSGPVDQQGYTVRQYEVEVKEETEISAEIEDVDPPSGDYTAGEDVTAETTIRNTGNVEHEFYVGYSVRGPDDEWRDNDRSTHESVWVDPGEEETVDVEWEVEDDAPTGEYDIWTSVYRDADGDQLEDRLDERRMMDVFEVIPENDPPTIQINEPDGEDTLSPGEEVRFEAEGQDPDGNLDGVEWYVESEFTGDSSDLQGSTDVATWERTFDSPGTYEVEAVAFDEEDSYSDPVSWTITVEEPERIDAEITDIDEPTGEFTASETVEADISVENTGNTAHEFYVGYSVRGPDDEWRDNGRSTHESVWVEPGEEKSVGVEWDVEEGAPVGEYDILTSVYRDVDGDELEGRLGYRLSTNVFDVVTENSPPTIDVDEPERRLTVPFDETVEFEIEAEDPDRNLDGVEWYVEGEFTGDTSEVAGGADSATWTRTFDSPGTYEIEAQVFDEEESYSETASWTITVEEPEKIDAQISDVDPPRGEFVQSETVEASVRVRNTGNTAHEFHVGFSVRGPDGKWRDNDRSTHESVWVEPDEEKTVDVEWEVGEDAPAGEYDIWTSVYRNVEGDELEGNLDDKRSPDVFSVVSENAPPTIEVDEPDQRTTVPLGETVEFEIDAEDTDRNLDGVEWYIGDEFTGELSELYGGADSATWTRTFDSPGTYEVEAEAFDEEQAYSGTASWTVTVEEPEEIDAQIGDVDVPNGEFKAPETTEASVTIRNTGNTEHEFYVGYSVRGPDGEWRDNDRSTHEPVWVEPGEEETVDVEWEVEEDAPAGEYDIWTSVYRDVDGDELADKLDEEREPDAFGVAETNTKPILTPIAPNRETTVTAGDTVEFVATATDDNGNLAGVDWYLETDLTESTDAFGEEDESRWTHTFDSAGTYKIEVQAHDEEDAYSEPLSWTVTVEERERVDARIEDISTGSSGYTRGDTVETVVNVNNTGNTEDTFLIHHSVVGPRGDRYGEESEREVSLTPGEDRSVTLRWTVNENAPAGAYDTRVSIRTDSDSVESDTPLDSEADRSSFAVEPNSTLRGTIELADGGPVAGALVRIDSQQVRTNDNGEFQLENLPAGEHEVTVTADAGSTTRELRLDAGETRELDIEIGAAAEIANTVGPSTIETEESFSLGIRVRNTGASEQTFSVAVPNSLAIGTEGPAEQEITLSEGESALVRFDTTLYAAFSGDGIPITVSTDGAVVATGRHSISVQRTGVKLTFVDASGDLLTDTRVIVEGAPTQYTDESGTIQLTGLDPGEYSVEVGPATNPYDPVTVTVTDGEIRERRIQMSTGSTLAVTVLGEQPIESARVTLYSPDGTAQTKRTNANGETSFRDLASGRYSVYVSGDAVSDDVIRDISVSGKQQIDIDAEAAAKSEPVALSGQLTTKQGDSIQDATIRVSGRSDAAEFTTDSAGQFRTNAEYLPDETYTIRVSIDGAVWEYRKITPEEDGREFDLTVPDVAVATREADEAGEDWLDSTTAGEALGSFVGFATESAKQSIFRGITPDKYSFGEISSERIESVDVSEACADTHVTATTECLASSNQLRHERSIGSYGSMMGAASAFQNTVESIRSLPQSIYVLWQAASNPVDTVVGAFESFVYLTTHPEVLEQIVERLPQRVIEQQKADNPFPEGSVDHNQFADAWYSGYVTFVAAEMVVARGAGKAAQASTYASKVSSKLDSGRAYLKTVGGRDQLGAYMRNRRNLPDPTDAPGYSAVIRRTGDDGDEFREKLSDDELALFLKLEQTDGIPRERLKQFVEDSGQNGAFLVKNSIDKGDSDMLRWMFTVDQDREYADIWDEWRADVAQKYAVSQENDELSDSFVRGATHEDLRRYVGAVHKEATSDKVVGYRDHMQKIIEQTATRNNRDGYSTELSSRTREAESVATYARRNDVTQVVVEPEIEGTDKDIDLFVRRAGDRPDYVEVKEWTPRFDDSRGANMRDLLFGERNANAKFAEAEDIDGTAVVEVVVSEDHDRDELQEIIEKQIRTHRAEDGEIHFDAIRVRDMSGTTQTGRITAGDITWGAVVGAAATSDNDGEDSEEQDRIVVPDQPDVSVPLSTTAGAP
ncbi:hypothetical protein DJ79_09800 [Halorubrum ezzemoulense]|uniref:Alpha-galactosidase NEW3 domain-containing protein n=1 Tax=Halorubrum ezzemoulense TaxID=337243 RepID=A0A256JDX4_HALEZ|nr:carboxypeptidase regulatory-like domain-containing protein [Halorubrum ezzemoulense]OYR67064.1 hypothetical protein DJ79_09800 [Halorubrum ezzemoulense]